MSGHDTPGAAHEITILAVDDRAANLIALERVLAALPVRLVKATSGEEALAASLRYTFALAILDVQMPGMDGYELAELLHGDPATAGIPIIFVTAAHSDETHQFKGYSAGAVDYLVKPYDPAILLSKVRVFIELARHRRDLEGLVTERTRALAASEERYRTLFETMAQGVVYQDPAGRIIDANPAAVRILGMSLPELLARNSADPAWDAMSEQGVPMSGQEHPSMVALRTGQPVHDRVLAVRVPHRRERVWLRVTAIPQMRHGSDEVQHVYTTFSDISAQREAEQRVVNSERALRAVFDGSQDGIIVVERDSHGLRIANHAALVMLGLEGELPPDATLRGALSPEHLDHLEAASAEPTAESPTSPELVINRADGSAIVVEASATSLVLRGERCLIAVLRDMTRRRRDERDRRRLQEDLFQAQKMESIGVLAAGVAHDFNNLLSVISGYVELTLNDPRTTEDALADLREVKLAADRSAELTRKLLTFGRRQSMRHIPLDLNEVARGTGRLLRRIIGEDIELVLEPGDDLGVVVADAGQIEQVIMNLAANARDAMRAGGVLRLGTRNAEVDAATAARHPGLAPGRYVVLSLADDGCGMDEVTARRVFEPFFTTKPEGKGTGLGLSTVYGIVKQSGGRVVLTSEPGVGSTFEVYLPRLEGVALDAVTSMPPTASLGGEECVLVVEDADPVRSLSVRILDGAGYRVLTAVDGVDALRILETNGAAVDLVLTDVVMPRMGGEELAAQVAALRLRTGVLFMSGYTGEAFRDAEALVPGHNFISKPFAVDDLLRMVREVLDRHRVPSGRPWAHAETDTTSVNRLP